MRFSSSGRSHPSDAGTARREALRLRPSPGDVVIHCLGVGTYAISRLSGERIGTSHDRFDAMCRACAAARDTGANVWIRMEGATEVYHEVLCP
jgi:hypothetical protein